MAINSRFTFSNLFYKIYSFFNLEIMLKDPNFNVDYVYTGLVSPTKQVTDAYWSPRNISVCFYLK
jgi:hypothetical protein